MMLAGSKKFDHSIYLPWRNKPGLETPFSGEVGGRLSELRELLSNIASVAPIHKNQLITALLLELIDRYARYKVYPPVEQLQMNAYLDTVKQLLDEVTTLVPEPLYEFFSFWMIHDPEILTGTITILQRLPRSIFLLRSIELGGKNLLEYSLSFPMLAHVLPESSGFFIFLYNIGLRVSEYPLVCHTEECFRVLFLHAFSSLDTAALKAWADNDTPCAQTFYVRHRNLHKLWQAWYRQEALRFPPWESEENFQELVRTLPLEVLESCPDKEAISAEEMGWAEYLAEQGNVHRLKILLTSRTDLRLKERINLSKLLFTKLSVDEFNLQGTTEKECLEVFNLLFRRGIYIGMLSYNSTNSFCRRLTVVELGFFLYEFGSALDTLKQVVLNIYFSWYAVATKDADDLLRMFFIETMPEDTIDPLCWLLENKFELLLPVLNALNKDLDRSVKMRLMRLLVSIKPRSLGELVPSVLGTLIKRQYPLLITEDFLELYVSSSPVTNQLMEKMLSGLTPACEVLCEEVNLRSYAKDFTRSPVLLRIFVYLLRMNDPRALRDWCDAKFYAHLLTTNEMIAAQIRIHPALSLSTAIFSESLVRLPLSVVLCSPDLLNEDKSIATWADYLVMRAAEGDDEKLMALFARYPQLLTVSDMLIDRVFWLNQQYPSCAAVREKMFAYLQNQGQVILFSQGNLAEIFLQESVVMMFLKNWRRLRGQVDSRYYFPADAASIEIVWAHLYICFPKIAEILLLESVPSLEIAPVETPEERMCLALFQSPILLWCEGMMTLISKLTETPNATALLTTVLQTFVMGLLAANPLAQSIWLQYRLRDDNTLYHVLRRQGRDELAARVRVHPAAQINEVDEFSRFVDAAAKDTRSRDLFFYHPDCQEPKDSASWSLFFMHIRREDKVECFQSIVGEDEVLRCRDLVGDRRRQEGDAEVERQRILAIRARGTRYLRADGRAFQL